MHGNTGSVRCVRGTPSGGGAPSERHVRELDDSLVRGARTGIVWRKAGEPAASTDAAVLPCSALSPRFALAPDTHPCSKPASDGPPSVTWLVHATADAPVRADVANSRMRFVR